MSNSVVIINSKGKFLKYHETSCHSQQPCYAYEWVSILDDASIVRPNVLEKLNWKNGSPMSSAVKQIDATVTRVVTLQRNP